MVNAVLVFIGFRTLINSCTALLVHSSGTKAMQNRSGFVIMNTLEKLSVFIFSLKLNMKLCFNE